MNPALLDALEAGQRVRSRSLMPIAVACGVRPEWLCFGEAPMLAGGVGPSAPGETIELFEGEREIVELWRRLDPATDQPAVRRILRQMAKSATARFEYSEAEARARERVDEDA